MNNSILTHQFAESVKLLQSSQERYHKNVLYITPEQQEKLKSKRILFAGVGLGSVIAEAALRLGIENLILLDGDVVEVSNLNRQNYTEKDIEKPKVEAIRSRLLAINPDANIEVHQVYLNPTNMAEYLNQCDIAINAIDFDDEDSPFNFDRACKNAGITVVHPFNFGWAGAAYVVTPESAGIVNNSQDDERFELDLISSFLAHYQAHTSLSWLNEFNRQYKLYSQEISPPQLVVGSYMTAAIVTDVLYCLINQLPVKTFPESYFLTAR